MLNSLTICVAHKNRSRVKYGDGKYLELFPQMIDSLNHACIALGNVYIDMVITDFNSTEYPPESWIKKIANFPVKVIKRNQKDPNKFNRGYGLNEAAKASSGQVLFFCDTDMLLSPEILSQGIHHALRGEAFFPICWSYSNPEHSKGWWRDSGYGMVFMPKQMWKSFKWPEYDGWGFEDNHMKDNLKKARIPIIRDKAFNFFHQWHPEGNRTLNEQVINSKHPATKQINPPHFKVVVPVGFAEDKIEKCINSIINQNYTNWECRVVCDPCDNSYEIAKKLETDNIKVIKKSKREYQLKNLIDGLDDMTPNANDVVIVIDGDDSLIRVDAFDLVVTEYINGALVTHGTFVLPQVDGKYAKDFHTDSTTYKKKPIREISWKTSHLRTFKYGLFTRISDEDLRDEKGNYFKAATDQAVMFPVIEMAGGDRVGFVTEPIYLYNHNLKSNLKNKAKTRSEQQINSKYLRDKNPYTVLTSDVIKDIKL